MSVCKTEKYFYTIQSVPKIDDRIPFSNGVDKPEAFNAYEASHRAKLSSKASLQREKQKQLF